MVHDGFKFALFPSNPWSGLAGFSSLCVQKTWTLRGKFEKSFDVACLDDIRDFASALFHPRSGLELALNVNRHDLCEQPPGIV
jgi:hypothetical protein